MILYGVSKRMGKSLNKSLARPGRKQARKHVRDAHDFSNMETRAFINFPPPPQGKAPKEIHAIMTETLACFLPGGAKDLSAPLQVRIRKHENRKRTCRRGRLWNPIRLILLTQVRFFGCDW